MLRKHNRCVLLACVWLMVLLIGSAQAELIGWWTFDDGAGAMAVDSSGNGNDGTLIGDPAWDTEEGRGGILLLDGTDDHMVVQGNYVLPLYSMALWFRIDGGSTQQNIFGAYGAAGELYGAAMQLETDGRLRYVHRFPFGSSGGTNIYTDTTYNDGAWYHAAIVKAPDTMTLYINGEVVGTAADGTRFNLTALTVAVSVLRHDNLQRFVSGAVDDLQLYDHALSVQEVQQAMMGLQQGQASAPTPADDAVDVLREVVLAWTPGEHAHTHDVYLATVFEDVNDAGRGNPGAALVSRAQTGTEFSPAQRLDFGTTYYWRVDEVNAAPDNTVFKGDVWHFEVEPVAIPIDAPILATASGFNPGMEPGKTVDGSGLNESDQHSSAGMDMWLTATNGSWIQYEFDQAYKLRAMQVWNSNQTVEPFIGFGIKKVVVESSLDGVTWTVIDGTPPFAQGTGQATYEANTTVDLGGAVAQYVRITPQSAHGFTGQSGLSEVRFSYIPNTPREISPADGSTSMSTELELSWRAGREAAAHQVYMGSDPADLALVGTTVDPSFVANGLNYDQTYYWQVVEVNEAETPSAYASDIQSVITPAYGTVDDFESYSGAEGQEIFVTWFDGFGGDASLGGSTTGHIDGPFVETTNTYNGNQSMPVYIDNDGGFFDIDGKASAPIFSEVVRELDSQDWTTGGVETLSIMFAGSPGLTGQLYCKINSNKLTYDGDASAMGISTWQAWNIDLATVGGNLTNVKELAIGIENGSSGILYIDAIRLYPRQGEVLAPVMPDTANLLAHYALDGDYQDASGNGRHGVPIEEANIFFIAGVAGQALDLASGNGYVEIPGFKGITAIDGVQQPFTIANWFKTTETSGDQEMVTWGASPGTQRLTWRVHEGRLRTEHGSGNLRGNTYVNDGEWHFGALTVAEGANLRPDVTKLYVDGLEDSTFSGSDNAYDLQPDADVCIGCRADDKSRFFIGVLDEVRIYNRVLSPAEIAALAGKTKPIHVPF